jgi:ABC-type transporter Mla MlaB component
MTASMSIPLKVERRDGVLELQAQSLAASDVAILWPRLETGEIPGAGTVSVRINLSSLDQVDSSGVVFVAALRRRCLAAQIPCELLGASAEFLTLLAGVEKEPEPRRRSGVAQSQGSFKQKVYAIEHEWLMAVQGAFSFCGEVALVLFNSLRQPHLIRWRQTLIAFECASVNALGIVSLVCFLTGVISHSRGRTCCGRMERKPWCRCRSPCWSAANSGR